MKSTLWHAPYYQRHITGPACLRAFEGAATVEARDDLALFSYADRATQEKLSFVARKADVSVPTSTANIKPVETGIMISDSKGWCLA